MSVEPSGGHVYVRAAYAVEELLLNVNTMAPNRSRRVDGIVGDKRHAAEHSGHNPNSKGIACAVDVTNDPAHGADMAVVSELIRESEDQRVLYVIFNGRIFDGLFPGATKPFVWRKYVPPAGGSMHTDHMHVSMLQIQSLYDNRDPWEVEEMATLTKDDIKEAVREVLAEGTVIPPGETGQKETQLHTYASALLQVWGHVLRTENTTKQIVVELARQIAAGK